MSRTQHGVTAHPEEVRPSHAIVDLDRVGLGDVCRGVFGHIRDALHQDVEDLRG